MRGIQKIVMAVFLLTDFGFGVFLGMNYLGADTEGPVITDKEKTLKVSIQDSDEELLKGIKAVDDKDGDVSDSLIIERKTMGEDGKCVLSYAAFDESNNVSKGSRTVEFTDYHSPHFTINQPLRFSLGSESEIMNCVGAEDCIDGNISSRIKITKEDENEDYNGEGIYNYQLEVTNSIGDTSVLPISVEFYVDSYEERLYHPNMYLTTYVAYLEQDSEFDPMEYLKSVEIGSELYVFGENIGSDTQEETTPEEEKAVSGVISYDKVKYQSDVDTSKPGNYTVEYSCMSQDGYMGTTQLIVVVE